MTLSFLLKILKFGIFFLDSRYFFCYNQLPKRKCVFYLINPKLTVCGMQSFRLLGVFFYF